MTDFEKMSVNELETLKANVDKELAKRKRLEYDKLLEKFADALYELSSKFPNAYCFTDEAESWAELHENYSWNF